MQDRVRCELGDLPLAAPMNDGAVDVMLRPEQIRVLRDGETLIDGTAAYDAVVTEVTFQGQDAGVALQLQSGSRTMVRARVPGYLCPRPGEQVRLAVDGERDRLSTRINAAEAKAVIRIQSFAACSVRCAADRQADGHAPSSP